MVNEFGLKIVSPSASHESQKSGSVTVPGSQGYLTILPGHTAMVAELGIGELQVSSNSGQSKKSFFVSGGFVEVKGDEVVVLADVVEAAEKIDLKAAEDRKLEIVKDLTTSPDAETLASSQKMLKEVEYRIKLAKLVAK